MIEGEKIIRLVRSMQKLNSEIAALIKTFDKVMGKRGYIPRYNSSKVIRDCSYTLDSPELWTPPYMHRLLWQKNNHDDVFDLNIVLDDPEKPGSVLVPLLLGARIQFKKGMADINADPWLVWHLWFGKPAKKLNQLYTTKELQKSSEFREYVKFGGAKDIAAEIGLMATPLMSVTGIKALEEFLHNFFKK